MRECTIDDDVECGTSMAVLSFPETCLSVTCVLFSLLRSEAHVGWDGLLRVTNVYA